MRTLLIVEHNKRDRSEIRTAIHRSGISIDMILECKNGEEALHILTKQKVDVMLTAIEMPKVNGISLVKEAQKLEHPPKVVVISGSDYFIHAVQLLRLGVRDYLLKPINHPQLIKILTLLDEETNSIYKTQATNSILHGQELKQLLLDPISCDPTSDYTPALPDFPLFNEPYVLCCLDNQGQISYVTDEREYLGNVEQCELYIVKEELLDTIRLQEWRRRFVGISASYIGIEHLHHAYQEAFSNRRIAFYKEKPFITPTHNTASLKEKDLPTLDISIIVNLLGTDKSSQALKSLRTLIWNATRNENLTYLQENITLFFQALEQNYPTLLQQEEYEVYNLKHPFSYSMISAYEHALIHWTEDFIVKLHTLLNEFKDKEKMQTAIAYIKAHYNKDFNMAVVSNHVSMNYSLFSIAFKEYTGTNFVTYLKQIRMEKAKDYLENTTDKVSEISKKIGYENEKHFMKTFKVVYGVSPTEYRKNLQLRKQETPLRP